MKSQGVISYATLDIVYVYFKIINPLMFTCVKDFKYSKSFSKVFHSKDIFFNFTSCQRNLRV